MMMETEFGRACVSQDKIHLLHTKSSPIVGCACDIQASEFVRPR